MCADFLPEGVQYKFWGREHFDGKLVRDGTLFLAFFDFSSSFPRKVRKPTFYTMYKIQFIYTKYNGCPGNLYKRRSLYV